MIDRPASPFRWQDGERLIVFGNGTLHQAPQLLSSGYTLLTTRRATEQAGGVAQAADAVHEVGAGRVDELAGELRGRVRGELLVALGGGRIIDTAKALAAADPPRRVAAIPTTLSGAEMTPIHRHAAGLSADMPRVRPAIVINDPRLSASQPLDELAASACNALGHAAEGPLTPMSNPVATLASLQAARLLVRSLASQSRQPDRDALALGALLAGYVISSTGYGLHHVLSQTLVRFTGISHAHANAIMLPHALRALESRAQEGMARLAKALGEDPAEAAARLCALTGVSGLRELGVSQQQLVCCAEEAATRAELQMTPPAADRDELHALYAAAY